MAQAVCVPLAVVRGQKRGHAPVAKARPRLLLKTDPQQRPLGTIPDYAVPAWGASGKARDETFSEKSTQS